MTPRVPVSPAGPPSVVLCIAPAVSNVALNRLFAAAWGDARLRDFAPVLRHSLTYVCAFATYPKSEADAVAGEQLVGFVNVAWDGGIHAFLLDTTVHPNFQRRGIGRRLVLAAAAEARARSIEWLHVDYEPHLESFYTGCGFTPTLAGLLDLTRPA